MEYIRFSRPNNKYKVGSSIFFFFSLCTLLFDENNDYLQVSRPTIPKFRIDRTSKRFVSYSRIASSSHHSTFPSKNLCTTMNDGMRNTCSDTPIYNQFIHIQYLQLPASVENRNIW